MASALTRCYIGFSIKKSSVFISMVPSAGNGHASHEIMTCHALHTSPTAVCMICETSFFLSFLCPLHLHTRHEDETGSTDLHALHTRELCECFFKCHAALSHPSISPIQQDQKFLVAQCLHVAVQQLQHVVVAYARKPLTA